MEFTQTKTCLNLARSFAGECMAGMRYQFLADMATTQGYAEMAKQLKMLAKNETMHAKSFIQHIYKHVGNIENIDVCAGYPFNSETLQEGLKNSVKAEQTEVTIYNDFALTARQEGFEDIANTFELVSKVEQAHVNKFAYLSQAFDEGTLYKSSEKKIYRCANCGHTYEDYEAWTICPLCQSSQGFVEIEYPCANNNEKE